MSPISRRRFLGGLAAGIGLGAAGVTVWSRRPNEPAASPSTQPTVTTTTQSPTTTSTTTATTSTSTTTSTTTTTTTPEEPGAEAIPVICRQAWGARNASGPFTEHEIEYVTVHHTAVLLEDNADAPARARQHQAYHQDRGWPDLAYHFLVDADGNVYEGRPVGAVGDTGTEYDPTGHLLICCEGNFDEQQVPDAQYASLVKMVAWGCEKYRIDPAAVRGHRDVASTSCPGDDLYRFIADGTLAADVSNEGALVLETLCGEEGAALVEAISAGV